MFKKELNSSNEHAYSARKSFWAFSNSMICIRYKYVYTSTFTFRYSQFYPFTRKIGTKYERS